LHRKVRKITLNANDKQHKGRYNKQKRNGGISMSEFIITLLFGWLGVHKFIQKKYVWGVVYLCTLGLCGVGWCVDTIAAFTKLLKSKQTSKNNINICSGGTAHTPAQKQLVKSFDTVIVGTFANCRLDRTEKRQDLIGYVKPKWELHLQQFEYEGEPAYYVCHPNGLDLGCVPAEIAKTLYQEYRDCEFKVMAVKRIYDDHDNETFNIKIEIYR
jgi:TM2 domain-containing membrane protein YozV